MPTTICPFAPSYLKSLQEHIVVGVFFICILDDYRMDSSLVSRYLYAKSLLPITTILGTEFVNGELVIVQCYKYVSVVTYIGRDLCYYSYIV